MADDISVVFGAQIAGLVAGVEGVKEEIETIGGAAQGLISTFTSVGTVIAEAFAIEQIQGFVEHMAEMGTDMARMGEQTGMTADQMNILKFAAEGSDTQLQMLTRAITQFDRMAEESASGTGHAADAFRALGINAKEYLETGHSLSDLFTLTTQKLSGFSASQEKAAAVSMLFGGRSSQLIKVLDDLGGKYDEIKAAVDRSQVTVEGFNDAAEESKKQLVELDGSGRALEETLFVKLKPAFDLIEGGLINMTEGLTESIKDSKDLSDAVKLLAAALKLTASFAIALGHGVLEFFIAVQTSIGATTEAIKHGFTAGKAVWDEGMNNLVKDNIEAWNKIADIWDKSPIKPHQDSLSSQSMGRIIDLKKEQDDAKKLMDEDIASHKRMLDLELADDGENLRAKMAHATAYYEWLKGKYAQNKDAQTDALRKISEIQNQEIRKEEQQYTRMLDSFNNGIKGMITGTMTLKSAMQSAVLNMLMNFIKEKEVELAHHVATEQIKTAATIAGSAERAAAEKTAATASSSIFSAAAQKAIMGDAAKAYAGTYGFLSPVMGPLAAVPAAGSFAAVMAMEELVPSFAVGSRFIAHDTLAQLHKGEKVLTAEETRSMDANSGGQAITMNFNGPTDKNYFMANSHHIAAALANASRNFNPALSKAVRP